MFCFFSDLKLGRDLSEQFDCTSHPAPDVVIVCVQEIEKRGLEKGE